MSVTIKPNKMKYKDSSGNYVGVNAIAERTTAEEVADIQAVSTTAQGEITALTTAKKTEITNLANTKKTEIDNKATEVTSQLANAAEVRNMLAGTFSTSTNYTKGQYVIQTVTVSGNSVNKLYRFTADHPAGNWLGTDVVEVKLADDVSSLSSAFIADRTATSKSLRYPAYAHFTALDTIAPFYAKAGDKILIWADAGFPLTFTKLYFLDKNKQLVTWYTIGAYSEYKVIESGVSDIYYAYISGGTAQDANIQNQTTYYCIAPDIEEISEKIDITTEDYNNFKAEESRLIKAANLFNGNTHNGIHSQTNGDSYGTATANENYFYTDLIPVSGLSVLYVFTDFIGLYTEYITFFNSSKKVIGKTNGYNQFITSFPAGTVYAVVCSRKEIINSLIVSTSIPTKYHGIKAAYIQNELKAGYKYKRLDRGIVNAYVTAKIGSKVYPLTASDNFICSYPISLEGISAVSYRANDGRSVTVVYFDEDGDFISNESLTYDGTATLTIPEGAVGFVYYAGTMSTSKYCFVEGSAPPSEIYGFDDIEIEGLQVDNNSWNPLYGKNILFTGDSITAGSFYNGGWVNLIGNNFNCNCTNEGHDGWTVGIIRGRNDNLLELLPTLGSNFDIIALSGGYNDFTTSPRADLGELTVGMNSELDLSTFCGCLESYIRTARTKWKDAKICYILTMKKQFIDYETNARQTTYWNIIRDCCKKYAIPLLDLYYNAGIVGVQGETGGLTEYYYKDGDATHPNQKGYDLIYTKIARFLMNL